MRKTCKLVRGLIKMGVLCIAFNSLATAKADAASFISDVHMTAHEGGEALITVEYTGNSPRVKLSHIGTETVVLQFTDSRNARGGLLSLPGYGSLLAAHFEAVGTDALLTLQVSAYSQVRFKEDARNIFVTISPGSEAKRAARPSQVRVNSLLDSEIIQLKYADVSEIAGIIVQGQAIPSNDVFIAQPSQLGSSNGLPGNGIGGLQQPSLGQNTNSAVTNSMSQGLGQRISDNVAIDRRTNSIILFGSPDVVSALKSLVTKLDVQLPSVVIEAQVVELSDSAAAQVGIDYTNGGQLGSVSLQARSLNSAQSALNLQAAIFDVVSRGGGRILARPRVVALNGASASILTGDAIPIVTNILIGGSTTAVQQQVQYVQVGVNLQIQPRISDDGFVTSHVYSEVSSLTGYAQGFPQISQRVATTSAVVADGDSFVIGGLVQRDELRSLAKIPGLGDLPLLGSLFRYRNDSSTTTNLYIVITPHIIHDHMNRPPQDSKN